MVGAMPLAPTVFFGGFGAGVIMIAEDVGECSDSQWTGVAFVNTPGLQLQAVDRLPDQWVAAECQAGPFIDDGFRTDGGIPGKAREPIQIRHCQRTSEPVRVHPGVRDAGEASDGAMKSAAGDDVADGS